MELSIRDLIDQLEAVVAEHGEDVDVRVAYQPSWPLRGTVTAVTTSDDVVRTQAEADDEDVEAAVEAAAADEADEGRCKIVWLAVGSAPYRENPYAPKEVWSSSGW